MSAFEGGDVEAAKKLIENGENIERKEGQSNALLIAAIKKQDEDFVQFLLEKGMNPNPEKDSLWSHPLKLAIFNGHEKLVELLLKHHADPNKDNPLAYAVKQGASEAIIKLLIAFKADTHEIFNVAQTPQMVSVLLGCGLAVDNHSEDLSKQLTNAVDKGEEELVLLLLENGVDPNNKGGYWKTPLERALTVNGKKSLRIVELLVEHGASLEGMLHCASTPEIAEYLLLKGCKIDGYNSSGKTPLMCVDLRLASLLIEKGANLEKKNNEGATALGLAASQGNMEKCRLLIKSGATLEIRDNMGMTPLSRAVDARQIETVRYLINVGANLNTTDDSGMTPLMHCSVRGNIVIATHLLEKGAERHLKTTKPAYYTEKNTSLIYDPFPRQITIPAGSTAASIAQIFSNGAVKELIEGKN